VSHEEQNDLFKNIKKERTPLFKNSRWLDTHTHWEGWIKRSWKQIVYRFRDKILSDKKNVTVCVFLFSTIFTPRGFLENRKNKEGLFCCKHTQVFRGGGKNKSQSKYKKQYGKKLNSYYIGKEKNRELTILKKTPITNSDTFPTRKTWNVGRDRPFFFEFSL